MNSSNLSTISTLVGDGLIFTSNESTAGNGGAIRSSLSDIVMTNTVFRGNTAYQNGGAISNNNTLAISDSSFTGNTSRNHGGAIHNYYNSTSTSVVVNLPRTVFTGNYTGSGGRGGAIFIQEGTLNLEDVDFIGNTAGWNGGAIYLYAGGKTASLNIDTGTGATLDMQNALGGSAS